MNTAPELIIARKAIAKIATRFPSLTMIEEPNVPVELSIRLPVQPGLNYEVWLALQNNDELHFSVGNFWLEWFPCTESSRVKEYISAVTGFLSSQYRVLEHYRGKHCVKAELQAPSGGDWKTVGTWSNLLSFLPLRSSLREVSNTHYHSTGPAAASRTRSVNSDISAPKWTSIHSVRFSVAWLAAWWFICLLVLAASLQQLKEEEGC